MYGSSTVLMNLVLTIFLALGQHRLIKFTARGGNFMSNPVSLPDAHPPGRNR